MRSNSDADDVDDDVMPKRTFVQYSGTDPRTIIDDDDRSDNSATTTVDPPSGERPETRCHAKVKHYAAMFALFCNGGVFKCPLLAIASLEEADQTAQSPVAFMKKIMKHSFEIMQYKLYGNIPSTV